MFGYQTILPYNSNMVCYIKKESVESISLSEWRFWNTFDQINNTPHSY